MSNLSCRFSVGTFDCIVVMDGIHTYEHPAQLFFANAPQESLEPALAAHGLDLKKWQYYVSPYPSLLVDTGEHRVLVDTGAGDMSPTTGHLIANLQALGIAPDDVDMVILTHGHPDHIGGTVDREGQPAFPNARYVMSKEEWEFWTGAPDLTPLPTPEWFKEALLTCAANCLPPIGGQLDLADSGSEIVPGVRAIATSGHTPGHIALAISSEGEQLLCTGDVALHPVHLERPDWYTSADLAPQQALVSRSRLLDMAVAQQTLVHAFHFPYPGLGHVIRKGDAWQWEPIGTSG
jgi:glyoxylase-like metal-dependent hydrolase (beta-lactamase superfamily II)